MSEHSEYWQDPSQNHCRFIGTPPRSPAAASCQLYYSYPFDELGESHIVIQNRVVLENLDALRSKLLEIFDGTAVPLNISGKPSAVWGLPWLTKYLEIPGDEGALVRAACFLYHDVVDGTDWDSSGFTGPGTAKYKLTRAEFDSHLAAIARVRNTPTITARELTSATVETFPFLLTFDDGGKSAVTQIAGMLEKYGWRGHFFVTSGQISRTGFLNPEQIRLLRKQGHVIGSHSFSHPVRMSHCRRKY